ncbi:MAG: hypothetical protein QF890_00115 [Myxococcota bacterium]|jgi:hypothetical protein|nr:hypothetical protein [Deltaproteobacteria bacterium]MCP4241970.1 hypothetical protein [bacterium]MDP6075020.1 hypothetical protein [Myxococcota bacterium]MDP6244553.1 hypothetical protein [Myxococcota bacterium]MDP7076221.1 hypothetical protein [Myxococcota bacterium]
MYRILALLLAIAAPAWAGSPAAIPDSGRHQAEVSFQEFATTWMGKVRKLEMKNRTKPTVIRSAADPLLTYRGYGDDYSVELQPTGHPQAPYLGLLRYTEHVYSCKGIDAIECRIASTIPITEIFRFQYGRWNY